jgi:tRNA(Ile)-lysidine synthetase-like protein
MGTEIITFWKNNPQYWIPKTVYEKDVADSIILNKYFNHDYKEENIIGQIIWLDQFSRHFQRQGLYSEEDVIQCRNLALDIITVQSMITMDEIEVMFALMLFKHHGQYDFIFRFLHNIWLKKPIKDYPILQKFYIDTYKKAYTKEHICESIQHSHKLESYDKEICEWHPLVPPSQCQTDLYNYVSKYVNTSEKAWVSLSGGVDSMVLLTLLKQSGANVAAIHIIYGNREESQEEYKFLTNYCNTINVPLYTYTIEWLRREDIERAFYESMTRTVRFLVYKCLASENEPVILGHIQEDVVENIWTNIAHCIHLDNLQKMKSDEIIEGVRICRPFLEVMKKDIYTVSHTFNIPYLKNTTPSWSNRGKYREHFHTATIEQYGPSVDKKLIEFATAIQKQSEIIENLVYKPIYDSFKDGTCDITSAVVANVDISGWCRIFEYVCHQKLHCNRPSMKFINEFCKKLGKSTRMETKTLRVITFTNEKRYFLQCIA